MASFPSPWSRAARARSGACSTPPGLALGEAYVREDLDIEGDTGEAASLVYPIAARLRSPVVLTSLVPRIHALLNDDLPGSGGSLPLRRVSGDFEALWLGGSMVYSCAYFSMGDEDRDAAQVAKLDWSSRPRPPQTRHYRKS